MHTPLILFLSSTLSLIAAVPYTPPQAYNRLIDLPSALSPTLRDTLPPYSVSSSSHIAISNISTHSTSPNDLTVQCLPAHYGSKIPLADCFDAVSQITPDEEIHDWADRHEAFVKPHFPLPFRFMGRECHPLSFIYIIRVLVLHRQCGNAWEGILYEWVI